MSHGLLGVGDDQWLRESLRKDPIQELRECKEELTRKNDLLQRFAPQPHPYYRDTRSPNKFNDFARHDTHERSYSSQPYCGRTYAPFNQTGMRPVLEQRVYNERIDEKLPPKSLNPPHEHTCNNSALKDENSSLRRNVADLQMRVGRLLKGRDDIEAEGSASITIWDELITQLCDLFVITVKKENRLECTQAVISRMKQVKHQSIALTKENETIKMDLERTKNTYLVAQDTLTKMADQISLDHASGTDKDGQLNALNKNLLEAATEKDRLDAEVSYLKSRLDGANDVWEAAKNEKDAATKEKEDMNLKVGELQHNIKIMTSEANLFKANIANILSSPNFTVQATFEAIRDHLKSNHNEQIKSDQTISLLEKKLTEVTSQLERQCELHSETLRRAKRCEDEMTMSSTKYTQLEENLASSSILTTTLQNQRDRFNVFLQKLADALRVTDEFASSDIEISSDLLLERALQLGKFNTDEMAEKCSGIYSLKRQLKATKESLRSKELHIGMMRKKISRLEDEANQRSALSIDRDDAVVSLQKCQKKNERLRTEISNERQLILELKAKMSDVGEVRSCNMELIDQLQKAKTAVEKLTAIKEKQKTQIESLKSELKLCTYTSSDDRQTLQKQLLSLTSDLKTTKDALDETIKREKQLIEFREVMARMLGLDVSRLSVPDYEVISRLERLIQTHHAQTAGVQTGLPVNPLNFNPVPPPEPNYSNAYIRAPVEIEHNWEDNMRTCTRPRRQRY